MGFRFALVLEEGKEMSMDFIELWNETGENDPYWSFEELIEEDPELAEALWDETRIFILANLRLAEVGKGCMQLN